MKQVLCALIVFATLFAHTTATAQSKTVKENFTISGDFNTVVKNMGVVISYDTTALFENGGKSLTVSYPEGAFGKNTPAFPNADPNDTTKGDKIFVSFGNITSGEQSVSGATKIVVLSDTSFKVIREIDGKTDASYIFYKDKAIRHEANGEIVDTQLLP